MLRLFCNGCGREHLAPAFTRSQLNRTTRYCIVWNKQQRDARRAQSAPAGSGWRGNDRLYLVGSIEVTR